MKLLSFSSSSWAGFKKSQYILAYYIATLLISFSLINLPTRAAEPNSIIANSPHSHAQALFLAPNIYAIQHKHTATLLPNGKVLVTGGYNEGGILNTSELYDPATGSWTATGNMSVPRSYHSATLLSNGKVLVVGGYNNGGVLNTSELYDPATGNWANIATFSPARQNHTATLLPNGKVLVVGGEAPGSNNLDTTQLYDPTTNSWAASGALQTSRIYHTATLLPNGKVLVAGGEGELSSSELYDPATGTWAATAANMTMPRKWHTATLLANGKVLVVGGYNSINSILSSSELYDPILGTWTASGKLNRGRGGHTTTLLPNGKILVTGGVWARNGLSVLNSSELYDPATETWLVIGKLANSRSAHLAILLANGKVLLTRGEPQPGETIPPSELYDPTTGNWAVSSKLLTRRSNHTATLLPSGKILVAGGSNAGTTLNSSELYDSATGSWTNSAPLNNARKNHSALLLPDGKVLVVGGVGSAGSSLSSAELYDPATGSWTNIALLNTPRQKHTATLLPNGKVLVIGGSNAGAALNSSELYDPATGSWMLDTININRQNHTATLLPNGKVLVIGGADSNGNSLDVNELYNPATNTWGLVASLNINRQNHTATLLPNGKVLVAGGSNAGAALNSSELYDPLTDSWLPAAALSTARQSHSALLLPTGKIQVIAGYNTDYLRNSEIYDPATNSWMSSDNIFTQRSGHTTTLLTTGQVLVAGGANSGGSLDSSEIYDQIISKWSGIGNFRKQRVFHSVTLLPGGKVLLAGGSGTKTAELYDPVSNTSIDAGNMLEVRQNHSGVLLSNGKVLVVGGVGNTGTGYNSAELYNPGTNTWTSTTSMNFARSEPIAVALANGKVLVMGNNSAGSAELYDPATETWTLTNNMKVARNKFSATLLANGKVLAVGGIGEDFFYSSELYDPATNSWTLTDSLSVLRYNHTATLLPNGKVLVTGGYEQFDSSTQIAELYDPATGEWTVTGSLLVPRQYHSATLLPNGKVLVVGGDVSGETSDDGSSVEEIYDPATGTWTAIGNNNSSRNRNINRPLVLPNGKVLTAEGLFDHHPDFSANLQPIVNTTTSPIYPGSDLPIVVEGADFKNSSEASSGTTNSSPTNYPVVKLHSLSNEQVAWLPLQHWTATSITLTAPPAFPSGPAFLTVYVNAVPAYSKLIMVAAPIKTLTTLTYNPPTPVVNDNITLNAMVIADEASPIGLGMPKGTVTFKLDNLVLGTSSLNQAGVATYTYSSPFPYTRTVSAEFVPSSGFQPSISGPIPFTINAPLPNPVALYPASARHEKVGLDITIQAEKVLTVTAGSQWATEVYCQLPLPGNPPTTTKTVKLQTDPYNADTPHLIEARLNIECVPDAPGIIKIFLKNPTPGGGTSVALPFQYITGTVSPIPTILQVIPDAWPAGTSISGTIPLTLTGQNMTPNTKVYYNGQPRTISYVNSQTVRVYLEAADGSTPGIGVLQVQNLPEGSNFSNVAILNITPANYNPPLITSLAPISITKGGPDFALLVYGQNFYGKSQVLWNGSGRTTTYYSSTLLIADIGAGDIVNSGLVSVTVANPGATPNLSNLTTLEVVSQCLPNVVTIFEDGDQCGTLRAAIRYTAGGSFGGAYYWGSGRQSPRSFTISDTLDFSGVSVFFPCGLDGKPQYEILSKIPASANKPAFRVDNRLRPPGSLVPYLQGLRLKGPGLPLLSFGPVKPACLQVIK